MNVFKLVGGDLTSINSMLVRLAGPDTDTMIVETEMDPKALAFAVHVANTLAATDNQTIKEISVFGHQLGLPAKQRNLKFRIFCLTPN